MKLILKKCDKGKGREGKGREGKGREGKGREGKGREGKGEEDRLRFGVLIYCDVIIHPI